MGFKELNKFNDAMLAKQVWRLIYDADSLFYCVLSQNIFQMVIFFMQNKPRVLMPGRVF